MTEIMKIGQIYVKRMANRALIQWLSSAAYTEVRHEIKRFVRRVLLNAMIYMGHEGVRTLLYRFIDRSLYDVDIRITNPGTVELPASYMDRVVPYAPFVLYMRYIIFSRPDIRPEIGYKISARAVKLLMLAVNTRITNVLRRAKMISTRRKSILTSGHDILLASNICDERKNKIFDPAMLNVYVNVPGKHKRKKKRRRKRIVIIDQEEEENDEYEDEIDEKLGGGEGLRKQKAQKNELQKIKKGKIAAKITADKLNLGLRKQKAQKNELQKIKKGKIAAKITADKLNLGLRKQKAQKNELKKIEKGKIAAKITADKLRNVVTKNKHKKNELNSKNKSICIEEIMNVLKKTDNMMEISGQEFTIGGKREDFRTARCYVEDRGTWHFVELIWYLILTYVIKPMVSGSENFGIICMAKSKWYHDDVKGMNEEDIKHHDIQTSTKILDTILKDLQTIKNDIILIPLALIGKDPGDIKMKAGHATIIIIDRRDKKNGVIEFFNSNHASQSIYEYNIYFDLLLERVQYHDKTTNYVGITKSLVNKNNETISVQSKFQDCSFWCFWYVIKRLSGHSLADMAIMASDVKYIKHEQKALANRIDLLNNSFLDCWKNYPQYANLKGVSIKTKKERMVIAKIICDCAYRKGGYINSHKIKQMLTEGKFSSRLLNSTRMKRIPSRMLNTR
jgi:histone H3/H4